jgi:hypothetical protein
LGHNSFCSKDFRVKLSLDRMCAVVLGLIPLGFLTFQVLILKAFGPSTVSIRTFPNHQGLDSGGFRTIHGEILEVSEPPRVRLIGFLQRKYMKISFLAKIES